MTSSPVTTTGRLVGASPRARRQRLAVLSLLVGVAVVAASIYVYVSLLGPADVPHAVRPARAPARSVAGLDQRSYLPGQIALLQMDVGGVRRATLQVFLAGGIRGDAPVSPQP